MKKADGSRGALLCFLMNLLFHWELGLAALVLYVLHLWLGLPSLLAWAVFAVWLLLAMGLTYLVIWGSESAKKKTPPKENKNPYSASNIDAASGGRKGGEDQKD